MSAGTNLGLPVIFFSLPWPLKCERRDGLDSIALPTTGRGGRTGALLEHEPPLFAILAGCRWQVKSESIAEDLGVFTSERHRSGYTDNR